MSTVNFYAEKEISPQNYDLVLNELASATHEKYIEIYNEVEASGYKILEKPEWFIENTVKIEHYTSKFASVSYSINAHSLGEHSSSNISYQVYELPGAKVLGLSQIVADEAKVHEKVEAKFRKANGISPTQDLKDLQGTGFQIPNGVFPLSTNVALLKDGLAFYYNEYEIACYAQGPTMVVVPYGEIKDLLRPEVSEWAIGKEARKGDL